MRRSIFLLCFMSAAFLQADPNETQASSQAQMGRYCPCGCGCLAPCNCGCMNGKPCHCPLKSRYQPES